MLATSLAPNELFALSGLAALGLGGPLATALIDLGGGRTPFPAGAIGAFVGAVVLSSGRTDQPAASTSLARLR